MRTCLSAGVVEGGRGLDRHGGDGAVADLSARVAPSARLGQLLRLRRLASEVAAAHHLLRRRLAPESPRDQDLLRRRRLAPNFQFFPFFLIFKIFTVVFVSLVRVWASPDTTFYRTIFNFSIVQQKLIKYLNKIIEILFHQINLLTIYLIIINSFDFNFKNI